ncbi:MAG: hypothetical protein M1547_10490 [Gammaproteobacteria bacterium]|nr:hypothetical protein [Gammaproteobacteria bacterium]
MHKGGIAGAPKKFFVHLTMAIIFILLAAFSAWLLWLTYFRDASQSEEALAKRAVPRREMVYEPFHGAGESVLEGGKSQSWCLKCHKDYSHSKSKEVRGILNAHSFFMACEVCHIVPKEGERFEYKWLQRGSNLTLTELKGKPGDYGGTIVPFRAEKGVAKRLDENASAGPLLDEAVAANLLPDDTGKNEGNGDLRKLKDRLNTEIHKDLSAKPVFCGQCHKENGMLDFTRLLYSPERAQRLEFGDGATIIKQYKEFYLPTLHDARSHQ